MNGLKSQSAISGGAGRALPLRDLLVVAEIALSGIVIICAALLARSFAQTLAVNPGFDPGKTVATFYVVPGLKGYDSAGTYRLLEEYRRAAEALPGVTRASYGIRLPAQANEAGWSAPFLIPGRQPPPGKDAFVIRYTMVGPDYFAVMGTRILSGRGVTAMDQPSTEPVAIISETMARRFWPGESPIGRRIRMGSVSPIERQVVGVAEDIRISGLYEPPEMYVYVPYAQDPQSFGLLLVEARQDPSSVASAVKRRLAAIAPAVPVLAEGSLSEHLNLLLYEDRRNAWIAVAIALLASILGAVGVHGVVSLVTARRTKEIGIRVALGAGRDELLRLLLGRTVRLTFAGATLAIAGGLAAGRLLRGQLHGIDPADPWSFALGTLICAGVALAASSTPVWRAVRTDPLMALRDE